MIIRKLSDKRYNVVIVQGSPRKENSCADQKSKTEKIVEHIVKKYSTFIDFELVDLAVDGVKVQPCKGCISTSNGFHCHFKCSCYKKGSEKNPDLMYEQDVYDKLLNCDAFLIVTPIHWYSVSTQVKAMFDRLVCVNQTITTEQAIELFGKENIKDSSITGNTELTNKYRHLLKNHLAGKVGSFYCHGDNGASDYKGEEKPYTGEEMWDMKNAIMPLVFQCRYSEIEVPDQLIECFYINEGKEYYQANIDFEKTPEFIERADNLVERLLEFLEQKQGI